MTVKFEPIISELVRELLQPLVGLSGAEALEDLFEAGGLGRVRSRNNGARPVH